MREHRLALFLMLICSLALAGCSAPRADYQYDQRLRIRPTNPVPTDCVEVKTVVEAIEPEDGRVRYDVTLVPPHWSDMRVIDGQIPQFHKVHRVRMHGLVRNVGETLTLRLTPDGRLVDIKEIQDPIGGSRFFDPDVMTLEPRVIQPE